MALPSRPPDVWLMNASGLSRNQARAVLLKNVLITIRTLSFVFSSLELWVSPSCMSGLQTLWALNKLIIYFSPKPSGSFLGSLDKPPKCELAWITEDEGSFWEGHSDPGGLALMRRNMFYQLRTWRGEELFTALAWPKLLTSLHCLLEQSKELAPDSS